jgi:hypothetical protein
MAGTPANSMNLSSASGIVNWDGTATMATTALTQYNTLVGASANTIANIAPGTSNYVLTSNGASANPAYKVLPFTHMPWTDEASLFTAASNNGYFVTATFPATLPPSPAQGDTIAFIVDNSSAVVTVTANTGQFIRVGRAISASAGTAANNFIGDSLTLVYRASDTTWIASDVLGTWTVT